MGSKEIKMSIYIFIAVGMLLVIGIFAFILAYFTEAPLREQVNTPILKVWNKAKLLLKVR
jgi:hypothetical protein